MKCLKLNHIGIASENLDEVLAFYEESLGLTVEEFEITDEQKARVAFVPLEDTKLEIMESTDLNGPIGKYIEKKGPGIHHIAIEVDNIDAALEELKVNNVYLIDKVARNGAGGTRIAFVHPKASKGVLVELCQKQKKNKDIK